MIKDNVETVGLRVWLAVAAVTLIPLQGHAHIASEHRDLAVGGYVGLSYAPALRGVTNFRIGEPYSNGTRAVLPYKRDDGAEVLRADRFDWTATDTKITFDDSAVFAVMGRMGFAYKRARIELEVGHESFPARFHDKNGDHDSETGLYLLAKDMAYDVISGNTARLRESLQAQSAEDIESFAHVLHASHPDVDSLLCKNGQKIVVSDYVRWHMAQDNVRLRDEIGGNCGGGKRPLDGTFRFTSKEDPGLNAAVSYDGRGKWPNVSKIQDWWYWRDYGVSEGEDSSDQVAGEMTDMGMDNRAIVAGHLAKTIEGGEVVEIRSVTSTSVMVNACYDLVVGVGDRIMPYACVGYGGDFVAVGGKVAPKPAYKLKVGLSYKLSSSVYAHLGGYVHHVMGSGEYEKLRVYRLTDDSSPDGRTKDYAVASFGLSYTGGEMGVRIVF
ncbi:P44/Msp2 family outer membrane protein [Candidatus Anaplasma sp. TIGMIC]|uniref:P44/Msp2 family outer membrane protein n=1 Tax=Candidatus Anaplasma sp. TIGMIC TaxID=3020713 RepID=UPI00232A9DB7|nr:P44/Msp2 family outer membrane protein [Candidatus Anaplasma sp. TIGMIC]MDB1135761.1 P44/Msp2 family outer membrane protein [Candidatus Anaplasma sp. TIGMIC]